MKKILPSLLVIFIMTYIGLSCKIFRPCCNKTVAASSTMSLLTGKQWIWDTLYNDYTGPGTGILAYAREDGLNTSNWDNVRVMLWPDGQEDFFDAYGRYVSWKWKFVGKDTTEVMAISSDGGGPMYAKILRLDATHLVTYDETHHTLSITIAKPY